MSGWEGRVAPPYGHYRIPPAHANQACSRHVARTHALQRQALVKAVESQYPRIKIDVEQQLTYYKGVRSLLLPLIADTIEYTNSTFDDGKRVLVEGA